MTYTPISWKITDLFDFIPEPGHHRHLQELTPDKMVSSTRRRLIKARRKQGAKARCKR